MAADARNIYQQARFASGMTGEQAAELLRVDVATVRRWEAGTLTPPNARVADMVAVYDAPWLAIQHLRSTSEELDVIPEVKHQSLPTAVIRLCNMADKLRRTDLYGQLMEIAEDGIIDAQERPIFDELTDQLREFIAAVYQVALTTDYAETKKESPEAATSRLSDSSTIRSTENHRTTILTHSAADCNTSERRNFA